MVIQAEQITAWVGSLLWPLFRVGALLMVAPVFGARVVPIRIRIGLTFAVTIMLLPLLPTTPALPVFSFAAMLTIAQQVLIGVMLGFALQLVISAVVTGGQLIAMQMGLGFSAMVDPQNGTQTPVVSQFYLMIVVLTFLSLGGHLVMFEVLLDSFRSMPVGTAMGAAGLWKLVNWGGTVFSGAVGMALPAIASLLMVNFAFGIMTRAAPQLNIFAIGFPLTLLIGLVVIMVTLPSIVPHANTLFSEVYHLMRDLVAEAH
ncbi:MAG: flagellar biosynthetic protein FliR [Gammaproteobacteria bacterium]|nr:flagellar biosynthetic protein FliR [Gammaproteobacteria bacterium]